MFSHLLPCDLSIGLKMLELRLAWPIGAASPSFQFTHDPPHPPWVEKFSNVLFSFTSDTLDYCKNVKGFFAQG